MLPRTTLRRMRGWRGGVVATRLPKKKITTNRRSWSGHDDHEQVQFATPTRSDTKEQVSSSTRRDEQPPKSRSNMSVLRRSSSSPTAAARIQRPCRKRIPPFLFRCAAVASLSSTSTLRFSTSSGLGGGVAASLVQSSSRQDPSSTSQCTVAEWTEWGECSATCGNGAHTRTRAVTSASQENCPALSETAACADQPDCAAHCGVSQWAEWSPCNQMCESVRMRTITISPGPTGAECPALSQARPCDPEDCATNCEVSQWSMWGLCSATCGTASRSRHREMLQAPQREGAACPEMIENEELGSDQLKFLPSLARSKECAVPACHLEGTISADTLRAAQGKAMNPWTLLFVSVAIVIGFIAVLLALSPNGIQGKDGVPPEDIEASCVAGGAEAPPPSSGPVGEDATLLPKEGHHNATPSGGRYMSGFTSSTGKTSYKAGRPQASSATSESSSFSCLRADRDTGRRMQPIVEEEQEQHVSDDRHDEHEELSMSSWALMNPTTTEEELELDPDPEHQDVAARRPVEQRMQMRPMLYYPSSGPSSHSTTTSASWSSSSSSSGGGVVSSDSKNSNRRRKQVSFAAAAGPPRGDGGRREDTVEVKVSGEDADEPHPHSTRRSLTLQQSGKVNGSSAQEQVAVVGVDRFGDHGAPREWSRSRQHQRDRHQLPPNRPPTEVPPALRTLTRRP